MKTLLSIIIILTLTNLATGYTKVINGKPLAFYDSNTLMVYNSDIGDCPVSMPRCGNIPPTNS